MKPPERIWLEAHPGSVSVLLAAGVVIVGAGIKLAAPVLVPVIIGALLATVTSPLVAWLVRRGVGRVLAITAAVLADTGALVGLGALVIGSAGELARRLPHYGRLLAGAVHDLGEYVRRANPRFNLPDLVDPGAIVALTTSLVGNLAGIVLDLLLALVVAVFLLLEVRSPTDEGRHSPLGSDPVRRAIKEVNKYIAIKTATSAVTGLVIGAWIWLWDGELPVLFGLLAFVLNYIPNLGSILAAVPAIVLALLQSGPAEATVIAAGYLLINVTVGNVIEPRVMGRALGLSPLVVVLSVILWGWLLGPAGALLSALLTVMVKLFLSSHEDLRPLAAALGPTQPAVTAQPDEALAEMVVPQAREPHDDDREASE